MRVAQKKVDPRDGALYVVSYNRTREDRRILSRRDCEDEGCDA